jgi:hypothetical protein
MDVFAVEALISDLHPSAKGANCGKIQFKTEIGSWYLDEFGNPTREIKRRD